MPTWTAPCPGRVVERGLDRPFLLMDTAVHEGLNKDASWSAFWDYLAAGPSGV
ncbi:hypothetical protein [Streptomyces sp. NPDC001604]|uniref:hypothetical protein n=1 Tax=Streptomyces sp. NPDC001604 TaxID=3364593 RepID=UPI00368789A2